MQPFSRETIVDRRQPLIRWSAVVAGALAGAAAWLILQLLCMGTALSAIDPDHVGAMRSFTLGTTMWSLIVPLIAMFVGGMLAARVAGYIDQKLAGLHGLLAGAAMAVVGVLAIAGSLESLAPRSQTTLGSVGPAARVDLERAIAPVNARLKDLTQREISVDQLVDAAYNAAGPDGYVVRDVMVARLSESTEATRADIDNALRTLGKREPEVVAQAEQLGERRHTVMEAARWAGNALLGAGVTLLLGLGAALGGALLVARKMVDRRRGEERTAHTTAPYPITTPTVPPAGLE